MNESNFVINVFGRKPVEVQVGLINKNSGMPEAGSMTATQEIGEYCCPNYSTAWGKLKRDTKKELTGEIEFLNWGHPDGELIEIRYLPNCTASISIEYQKLKKFVPKDEDAEIPLRIGKNKFNLITQKNLALMLKHHGLNRSNGSRNPENRVTKFETFKQSEVVSVSVSQILDKQKAENIVIDAHNKVANLEVLATLFDLSDKDTDELNFNKLLTFSQNPENFFKILTGHATAYKATLHKAAELQLIDFKSEGVVTVVIGGADDILMTGVEGENFDERIEWITDHITEAPIYHALNRLTGELERFVEILQ